MASAAGQALHANICTVDWISALHIEMAALSLEGQTEIPLFRCDILHPHRAQRRPGGPSGALDMSAVSVARIIPRWYLGMRGTRNAMISYGSALHDFGFYKHK